MNDPGRSRSLFPVDSPQNSMDHFIGDSIDQPIGTVFTSLREIEPSPGLHRRLVEALAAHQAASATPSSRRPPPRLSAVRAAGWLSLAASLVLTVSFTFLHEHHHAIRTNPAGLASSVPFIASIPAVASQSNSCCLSERSKEPPHFASNHGAQRRVHRQAAATSTSQLASFPAPPLPLTPQEKLLLRVAQARNPQQSAVLNPAFRASLAARDDENFQIFFAPATTIKSYEPSN